MCIMNRFLLAHFHINYLCQLTTANKIPRELDGLKSGSIGEENLNSTYERVIERLERQPKDQKELAVKILGLYLQHRIESLQSRSCGLPFQWSQDPFSLRHSIYPHTNTTRGLRLPGYYRRKQGSPCTLFHTQLFEKFQLS